MDFSSYYKKYLADCAEMEADEIICPDDEDWNHITTKQLIDGLVAGNVGVGDVGDELASRGALGQVPGTHWGD